MPELDAEYNPIVSLFGGSWRELLLSQVILVTLILTVLYFSLSVKKAPVKREGLNLGDFIYFYFFDELRPWKERFLSKPKEYKAHIIFNGFLFSAVTIFVSIFAIINNSLLIFKLPLYEQFLQNHYQLFFPLVYFSIIVGSAIAFFTIQYHRYKNR